MKWLWIKTKYLKNPLGRPKITPKTLPQNPGDLFNGFFFCPITSTTPKNPKTSQQHLSHHTSTIDGIFFFPPFLEDRLSDSFGLLRPNVLDANEVFTSDVEEIRVFKLVSKRVVFFFFKQKQMKPFSWQNCSYVWKCLYSLTQEGPMELVEEVGCLHEKGRSRVSEFQTKTNSSCTYAKPGG